MVQLPLFLAVCVDQGRFDRELRRLGIESCGKFVNDGSHATTWKFECDDQEPSVIVGIRPGLTRDGLCEILVHEAVHVWQYARDIMGEEKPSPEFEAYSVQFIFGNLLAAIEKVGYSYDAG
jgi:hypothetical protein